MLKLVTLAALLCCAPLFAGLNVGDKAPAFDACGDVINRPECTTLADCLGDVILIKEWQVRDKDSVESLKAVQERWNKWGGKGLHVFMVHRLEFEGFHAVTRFAAEKGHTFPIAMGSYYDANQFGPYVDEAKFQTVIVGVDGLVKYFSDTGEWLRVLDTELTKVVYPGLGKHSVAKGAEAPAKSFAARAYGRAWLEAEKALASAPDDAKEDLKLIVERCKQIAQRRRDKADTLKGDKRYVEAFDWLELLAKDFKGHELADKAAAEIKDTRADKELKKELKAQDDLRKLIASQLKQDPAQRVTSLRNFAKANKDTRAAELAENLAGSIEGEFKKK